MDIGDLRRDYNSQTGLSRKEMNPDPIMQFDHWFAQARQTELKDPSAMSLATADRHGIVTIRTVLLKIYDQQGFVFFTNYESKKARQIAENPNVALLFPWLAQERQVKITGQAHRIPSSESLRYFLSRPRGSQLGAWVSAQSSIISSRSLLMSKLEEIRQRFAEGEISLPEFWGGYRVKPSTIEFWQGQPDRLHDRFQYTRSADDNWEINRLAP
ncbi:MAG: pyridoxamine 5'-phosphate oxidase [Gammaproteobacteria bacterium]|nr:pyridoxamine 5'-phosphate oxidase [Gammaproteobacteria bacterium]